MATRFNDRLIGSIQSSRGMVQRECISWESPQPPMVLITKNTGFEIRSTCKQEMTRDRPSVNTLASVGDVIDRRPIRRLQCFGRLLCGPVICAEPFDRHPFNYADVMSSGAWSLPSDAPGSALAAGLIGQAIGAFTSAPLIGGSFV